MSQARNPEIPEIDDEEARALDIRAQMKAARRNITEAAARVLSPGEPRSFRGHAERPSPRRRDS